MTEFSSKAPITPSAAAPQRRLSHVAAAVALVLSAACAPAVMAQSAPDTASTPTSSTNPGIQAGPVSLLFGGFHRHRTVVDDGRGTVVERDDTYR